jgi:hypothetical protein
VVVVVAAAAHTQAAEHKVTIALIRSAAGRPALVEPATATNKDPRLTVKVLPAVRRLFTSVPLAFQVCQVVDGEPTGNHRQRTKRRQADFMLIVPITSLIPPPPPAAKSPSRPCTPLQHLLLSSLEMRRRTRLSW